jgi:hypothetical protein
MCRRADEGRCNMPDRRITDGRGNVGCVPAAAAEGTIRDQRQHGAWGQGTRYRGPHIALWKMKDTGLTRGICGAPEGKACFGYVR